MRTESEEKLRKRIEGIRGKDQDSARRAEVYVQSLAAPPGSLGKLTDAAIQLAGITGKVKNTLVRRRIIVMCADNGVVEEGVSSTPQIVTLSQAVNMTRHLTGMSSLAAHFGVDVEVVDIGIATPYEEKECKILQRRIRRGTGNLAKEPAMSREEAVEAILVGVERAEQAARDGIDVIGVGEMGIGNTTTSSAVLAALTDLPVEDVTGRGGGLTDDAFAKKKKVIAWALELHGLTRVSAGDAGADGAAKNPNPHDTSVKADISEKSFSEYAGAGSALEERDPIDVIAKKRFLSDDLQKNFEEHDPIDVIAKKRFLSDDLQKTLEERDPIDVIAKVGGLDIAGMCGVFLGAAIYRIPVVIDGFISIVAALCAQRLCGFARDFMFPSHVSEEIGYMRAAQELRLDPWLHMNMRLGEGSGCPLAFQLLEASCALMNEMATFEQAKIDDGYLEELRRMRK